MRGAMDGLREGERHVGGAHGLVRPLDVGLGHLHRIAVGEVRLHRDQRARLLARGDEQGRLVGMRVEERAHAVAHARSGVQVDVRHAAARLREAIGHSHRDRLLQPQYVAEVLGERSQHRQLGRAGVAEDGAHTALTQQLERGLADSCHLAPSPTFELSAHDGWGPCRASSRADATAVKGRRREAVRAICSGRFYANICSYESGESGVHG